MIQFYSTLKLKSDFAAAVRIFRVLSILTLWNTTTTYAQWTRKADAIYSRAEANNFLYNNKLYIFGGFSDNPVVAKNNEVYDIATNKWSELTPFPAGKEITHHGIVLVDDKVWLIGGRATDAYGPPSSQVLIYDLKTNKWSDGPELIDPATKKPFPLGGGGYGMLGRTIHVFGGFGPTMCDDQSKLHLTLDVDKYLANPKDVTWENKSAPMPVPRNHLSSVVLGGKLYALGGQFKHDCGADDQRDCHVYDPVTDKWTRLTDLPLKRSHAESATFAVDGKILLAGGQGNGNSTQNVVYEFDPAANKGLGAWVILPKYQLPGKFLGLSAKAAGTAFIIANGALDNYANERNETYVATLSRTKTRTLGFSADCLSETLQRNQKATAKNLLFCVEDSSNFRLTSDAKWLTIKSGSSGLTTLNGVDVTVELNSAGLAPGNYTGKITATGASASTNATFCINLRVSEFGQKPSLIGQAQTQNLNGYSLNELGEKLPVRGERGRNLRTVSYISPNPAARQFRISFPDNYAGLSSLVLLDNNGGSFPISKTYIQLRGNEAEVDIAHLSLRPGLYSLAIVSTDGKTEVLKMVTR